jgi:hypothetical protein
MADLPNSVNAVSFFALAIEHVTSFSKGHWNSRALVEKRWDREMETYMYVCVCAYCVAMYA